MIRTVVIDSDTLTRYGLSMLAGAHPDVEVVGETGSAVEAAALVERARPDVVVVDVELADGNGLPLVRALRDRYADLGIVVMTSLDTDDVLFRALDHGASAFVVKTAPVIEVLGAIRHAAVAATSFTATGLLDALTRRREQETKFALSPRERQVLTLLRDGLSIPEIAGTIHISKSTAKTYVARLYDKLGASSRAQALVTALRTGLINYEPTPGS
ncbi:response regulator [Actinokineospora globicatena]|uniref:DNA-binding response regulator n=1 Tax=Actinokineospora globicatena TaxID=103729 RepID=A0A9W6QHT9_9PSEU|nr:response regulator transcription factor [Actinokineospora globicatena]MCP2304519.1 two component transcriptional regulator, LuxR family [Actinokineospora globicatena]GLW78112.1 DNA-binding response regulator [Actinokineospora globicatena]GLW85222.1 DNA-binding response regulator [Actinokineospora globicatena]GLW90713.1 DNA-binding response regulator [Actinokineospora globicatena]